MKTATLELRPYTPSCRALWDAFVRRSKNGLFLFYRGYMDYHSDRFQDCSLMVFGDDQLLAVIPANRQGGDFVSHGGLTFGSVIVDDHMNAAIMLHVFQKLVAYLGELGITRMVYKPVPHIYHRLPAEEDLYALFVNEARLLRRDVSTTIAQPHRLTYSKGRKWSINKARKAGLTVQPSSDFDTFMGIEEYVLRRYHGKTPVHSASEIGMLAERFPDHIKLFGAYRQSDMLAGVVIYENEMVAHTQYIAVSDEGRDLGAGDLVLDELINQFYHEKPYFDFGISTENEGRFLNVGLAQYKENFGGRSTVYDCYEVPIQGGF
jgi:hypothetical protein